MALKGKGKPLGRSVVQFGHRNKGPDGGREEGGGEIPRIAPPYNSQMKYIRILGESNFQTGKTWSIDWEEDIL